jgi:hypothetical protein
LLAMMLACIGCGSEGANANSPTATSVVAPPTATPIATESTPAETAPPPSEAPPAPASAEVPAEAPPTETALAAAPSSIAPSSIAPSSAAPPAPDDGPPKINPAATRPKADRTPRRPGEAEKITFDDIIIGVQADVVFRPWMLTERVQELEGQRVSIPGFMYGGVEKQSKLKDFVLLRNNQCKFGPGGQSDHLAKVVLRAGRTVDFTAEPLNVEGTLRVAPFTGTDGNTWAIYELDDAVIK